MNTRALKRSLQVQLASILSADALRATAPGSGQKHYFHVEAGITMEELNRLLDAQSPRLELQAAGGNRGATLAGAVSTSTHGSEFRIPLLSDRVKAVHLVGPGGQQWWIEGRDSIADVAKLLQAYPGLDRAHVIAGVDPIEGLMPQDWLNAVAVSMGCMGVIYSMVLEVFSLSGSQNVTNQTTWFTFLDGVQAQNPSLTGLSRQQLQAALRDPADANHRAVNAAIAEAITTKAPFSRGLVPDGENQHGELAFNPNPAPATSRALAAGDCDCWVVYRREVPLPFDSLHRVSSGTSDVLQRLPVS
jgi:FAD/FMN-containing dehydrogenase